MPDDSPSIRVTGEGRRLEISLPDPDQSVVPTIPDELQDRDVPSFVVEWVLESDEIATVVQEMVQAPTRSLCRAMAKPKGEVRGEFDPISGRSGGGFKSPTPPVLRFGALEVTGFSASFERVPGLPEGIKLPGELLDILLMARKVDAWITKGQRVSEWAAEEGVPDASWMPASA